MEMGMGMGGMERIFPAIKLRGLPYDVTEEDIRMFIVRQCKGFVSYRPARSNAGSLRLLPPLHRDAILSIFSWSGVTAG